MNESDLLSLVYKLIGDLSYYERTDLHDDLEVKEEVIDGKTFKVGKNGKHARKAIAEAKSILHQLGYK